MYVHHEVMLSSFPLDI